MIVKAEWVSGEQHTYDDFATAAADFASKIRENLGVPATCTVEGVEVPREQIAAHIRLALSRGVAR